MAKSAVQELSEIIAHMHQAKHVNDEHVTVRAGFLRDLANEVCVQDSTPARERLASAVLRFERVVSSCEQSEERAAAETARAGRLERDLNYTRLQLENAKRRLGHLLASRELSTPTESLEGTEG